MPLGHFPRCIFDLNSIWITEDNISFLNISFASGEANKELIPLLMFIEFHFE